jgi:hypothetical protein
MSQSKYDVTKETLSMYTEEGGLPCCRECGTALSVGDQIDGYYPYFAEHNLCKACNDDNVKETKSREWNDRINWAKPTDNPVEMWLVKELVNDFRFQINSGGQNLQLMDPNQYAVGYWEGLLRQTMSLIAQAPISERVWQAAGLKYEEYQRCIFEIIG